MANQQPTLVREERGGETYAYYPLGQYVVAAPGVCGGRPTFKYTRLEVATVLAMLASGKPVDQIAEEFDASELKVDAIREAAHLASAALVQLAPHQGLTA